MMSDMTRRTSPSHMSLLGESESILRGYKEGSFLSGFTDDTSRTIYVVYEPICLNRKVTEKESIL
jgi:hypothetical protein